MSDSDYSFDGKKNHKENGEKKRKRNGKSVGKKKRGKIIGFSILGVFLVILIAAGIYIYQALNKPASLFNVTTIKQQLTPEPMNEDIVPTVTPSVQPTATTQPFSGQHIVNILLLGLDLDYKSYAANGGDFHTDSIIVLAVNFDKNTVDMISLPRDSFTHVPGVKGIYKLNAAINCGGGKTDGGFKKVCEAASWMLGGINIDYYYAFQLDTVIKIGDMIGGVDFNVDMNYQGTSGKYYKAGMQHLDGTGINDYMRARHNAPDGSDVERMRRGKAMLTAIYKKLKDQNMLTQIPQLMSTINSGLYTNATLQQTIALANFAYKNINVDSIMSHTMAADIQYALGWKFFFVDQKARQELIKQVYGIDVPELQCVSFDYANWLGDYGFDTTRYLTTALELSQYIQSKGVNTLSTDEKDSYNALIDSYKQTETAYDAASISLSSADNKAMIKARNDLRDRTESLAGKIGYPNKLSWTVRTARWFEDPCINEVNVDFN